MTVISVPALAMQQSPGKEIFAFGIDGKKVHGFASVSRARRDENELGLFGYQRPEVNRHIAEIRGYLESDNPMVPNAVVIAFDKRVTFEQTGSTNGGSTRSGMLQIPVADDDADKVGWIVDGQQRLAAIREARIENFPIFAVGFIAQSDAEQKEQFLLVNATKPLSRGHIYELLPGVEGRLPTHLEKKKLPATLVEILNHTPESPLYRVVKTATNPKGRLRDNSLLKALENSISNGLLFDIHLNAPADKRTEEMARVLMTFWAAVREVWEDIWELPPRHSRLLHGAGVASLSFLMEDIALRNEGDGWPTQAEFAAELRKVVPACRWHEGEWQFAPDNVMKWNEVQNVSGHVRLVVNYLIRSYRQQIQREIAQ